MRIRTDFHPHKEKKNVFMVIALVLKEVFSSKKGSFKTRSLRGFKYTNTPSAVALEWGERMVDTGWVCCCSKTEYRKFQRCDPEVLIVVE